MKTLIFNLFALFALLLIVERVACDQRVKKLGTLSLALLPEHESWNSHALRAIPPALTYLNTSHYNVSRASPTCIADLSYYLTNILQPWALKMLDASTKIPESVASGAFIHLGNFDQCLDVTAVDENENIKFTGEYCVVNIGLKPISGTPEGLVLPLQITSCIPSTCTSQDMQEVLQITIGSALQAIGVQADIYIDPINCYIKNDQPSLDAGAWVMISIFIILGIFLIIGTCCDVFYEESSNTLKDIMVTFSVPRNFRSLISTAHSKSSIKCLHGLRVFSLLWVMIGHCYGTDAALPNINTLFILETLRQPWFAIIHNGLLAVDTFFYLSGFLVCYVFLSDSSKGRKFNPILYYVYRYLRLTTCLALLIGFYCFLLKYIGYGPLWRYAVYWQVNLCKQDWWLNLLYFNNYIRNEFNPVNLASICIDQGWYLTVDMQLSWLAPLVLLPLWRWPYYTSRLVLPLLVLASCLAPFAYTFIMESQMTSDFLGIGSVNPYDYGYDMYYATHMRATPYLVGISLAYFMFKQQDIIKIPKWSVLIGWLLSTIIGLAVVLGPAVQYQVDYEYNFAAAIFYSGFHRLAWSLVLSWIVFACSRGLGGPVNKILSWNVLLPLSRLAYCMYLCHSILLYYETGTTKTSNYYSHFGILRNLCSDVVLTSFIALVMHLSCEAPTLGLLRIFIRKHTGLSGKEKNITEKTEKIVT